MKRISDFLQMLPLWLLIGISKGLPFKLRVKIGAAWFGLIIALSKKLRRRLKENLQIALPKLAGYKRRKFVKKFTTQAGMTFTELIFNADFHMQSKNFEYKSSELEPLLLAARNKRPIIIVSAHFGPWEAIRAVLKLNNLTSGAIYKKNKNQFYESLHLEAIKAGGEPIFPIGFHGTKEMIKYLKSGGIISVLLDQAAEDGEYFDFMGSPAKTSTSMAKLAIKLNALLVPAYATRKDKDYEIKVSFEKPIEITNYHSMTARINNSIVSRILDNPTQWYWLHRRWKY